MKPKKLLAAVLAGTLFAVAPAVTPLATLTQAPSVAYAAKGGARIAAPRPSAPKTTPAAPKATSPDTHKSVSGNGGSYAPSKNAKDLDKNAPAANNNTNSKTNAAAASGTANTQSTSRLGSVLRGVGLLAGGMFLGSMLGNLLGFGGGFLSDVLGLLANVVLFFLAFQVIRWLIGRFLGRKNNGNNAQSGWQQPQQPTWNQAPQNGASAWNANNASQNQQPAWNANDAQRPQAAQADQGPLRTIDITPTESSSAHAAAPADDYKDLNGLDAKTIADRYRNR